MKFQGIGLETTVRVLPYDTSEKFIYEELSRIPREADERISFSILINIKQTEPTSAGKIQVALTQILDSGDPPPQRFRKVTIKELPLDDPGDLDEITTQVFRKDPWGVRQTFRLNVHNMPTQGPGSYAVVLFGIPTAGEGKKVIFDCAYFEVV